MDISDESRLSHDVAVSLREVSARIRMLDVDDETRADVARRLLAVTNTAKRDLAVAARRLERLVADLDGVHAGRSGTRGGEFPATQG